MTGVIHKQPSNLGRQPSNLGRQPSNLNDNRGHGCLNLTDNNNQHQKTNLKERECYGMFWWLGI